MEKEKGIIDSLGVVSNKLDSLSEAEYKKRINEIKGERVNLFGLDPILVVSISLGLIVVLTIGVLTIKNKTKNAITK